MDTNEVSEIPITLPTAIFGGEGDVQVRQRRLDVQRLRACYVVSHREAQVRKVWNPETLVHDLEYSVLSQVLAEHLAKDTYYNKVMFSAPSSTWQMFKRTHEDSWWLRWLTKRRPVKYLVEFKTLTVDVDRYLRYPDAAIQDPQFGASIVYEAVSRSLT